MVTLYRDVRVPGHVRNPEENPNGCAAAVDMKLNTSRPGKTIWDSKQRKYRTVWVKDKKIFKQCKKTAVAFVRFERKEQSLAPRSRVEGEAVCCCAYHANRWKSWIPLWQGSLRKSTRGLPVTIFHNLQHYEKTRGYPVEEDLSRCGMAVQCGSRRVSSGFSKYSRPNYRQCKWPRQVYLKWVSASDENEVHWLTAVCPHHGNKYLRRNNSGVKWAVIAREISQEEYYSRSGEKAVPVMCQEIGDKIVEFRHD